MNNSAPHATETNAETTMLKAALELIANQNNTIAILMNAVQETSQFHANTNMDVAKSWKAPTISGEDENEAAKTSWRKEDEVEIKQWLMEARAAFREVLDAKDAELAELRETVRNFTSGQNDTDKDVAEPRTGSSTIKGELAQDGTLDINDAEFYAVRNLVKGEKVPGPEQCHRTKRYCFRRTAMDHAGREADNKYVVDDDKLGHCEHVPDGGGRNYPSFVLTEKLVDRLPRVWNPMFKRDMTPSVRCCQCIRSLNPDLQARECEQCGAILHAERGFDCKAKHVCANDKHNGGLYLMDLT
jgi:hypothetical protein